MALDKSPERIFLEREIHTAHQKALAIALEMAKNEYDGNIETALADSEFVARVQNAVKAEWEKYQQGYERLEALEAREQFQAMRHIAEQLDTLSKYIPARCRLLCYYPFSGVDFYWARIFRKLVCEDIGFDMPQLPNMWWNAATYGREWREKIIALMKKERIIPSETEIIYLSGNAEESRMDNNFNQHDTTLLVKGGHDILGFLEKRFKDKLEFGAVIAVSSVNAMSEMELALSRQHYVLAHSVVNGGFLVPYAMELRDIYIFVRQE